MRLIDADKLKERFMLRAEWLRKDVHNDYSRGLYEGCETDMDLISEISTINPEDLRPKGKWIEKQCQTYLPVEYDDFGEPILHNFVVYHCDQCGRMERKKEPYCNCGAKMEE